MKKSLFIISLIFGLMPITENASAQANRDSQAPRSNVADALTGQLFGATICTVSLEETRLFYEKGFKMTIRGPIAVDKKTKRIERKLYDIPANIDWDLYIMERPSTPSLKIRLMVLNKPTPTIHQSWNTLELGILGLGFPNSIQPEVDSALRKIGFGAWAKMNIYPVEALDKSKYTVYETIFNGPDFVKGVGITRGDGMEQLGPLEENGYGGPAYSSMVVNNSDQIIDFYTTVLDYEVRTDRVWETSGALGVPAGTKYRFLTLYSKGAHWGHILFVDFKNQTAFETGVPKKIPNRGVGLWTFPCKNVDEMYKRAKAKNCTIVQKPMEYESPYYGKRKAFTLYAPNGFLIEIFQE
jgi:hypothetical protein